MAAAADLAMAPHMDSVPAVVVQLVAICVFKAATVIKPVAVLVVWESAVTPCATRHQFSQVEHF